MVNPIERRSVPMRLRVWGQYACFARPEMKVERVSYDVITPSAARGVFEAVIWRPEMRWIVERIDVLKPIRMMTVRRNEVGKKVSVENLLAAMAGRLGQLGINVEEERQQRASLVLIDVDYVIHARIALTERAGPAESLAKYVAIFRRRAKAGQCFQRPYLGSREFSAEFMAIDDCDHTPNPIALTSNLGWMLLDIDYSQDKPRPLFFEAKLVAGSLAVPDGNFAEMRR